MNLLRIGLITTALAIALPGSIAAQPPPGAAASPDAQAHARELYKKAWKLRDQGKTQGAYDALQEAWRLQRSFDIAANLAAAELDLGKPRDAAEHLAFALANLPPTVKETLRADLRRQADQARALVGVLKIEVSVANASVTVDGAPAGTSPLGGAVFVVPGKRVIAASAEGYAPAQQTIDIAKGTSQTVTLALASLPSPTPAPSAIPSTTPSALPTAAPTSGPPTPPTPRPSAGPDAVVIGGAAASGVGLVAGLVFAVVANQKAATAQQARAALGPAGCTRTPSACGPVDDALNGRDAFANAAFWSLLGAGVVGAGTLVYAAVSPRRSAPPRVEAAPVVGRNAGGMVVRGAW
jgi:hypothetical protein